MRLRGVALSAVSPCDNRLRRLAMHGGDLRFGRHSLGIVLEHGKPAQAVLEPLGDRHLRHQAPKDKLPGRIEPAVGQGVDHVIPRAGLDLVERLWRLGAAPAGQQRHNRKVGVGASWHNAHNPTPSGPKPEKPGAQPIERTASERDFTQPRKNAR